MSDEIHDIMEEAGKEVSRKAKRKRSEPVEPSNRKANGSSSFDDQSQMDDSEQTIEMRESLAILATLGQTKHYVGKDLCLADVHKMKPKEVERNYSQHYAKLTRTQPN